MATRSTFLCRISLSSLNSHAWKELITAGEVSYVLMKLLYVQLQQLYYSSRFKPNAKIPIWQHPILYIALPQEAADYVAAHY